jgi:SPP1 family predicted phage head-tail adaptor
MQFTTPIYLCKKQYSDETNDIGEALQDGYVERKVYASEDSAKRNEFYQANARGFKVEKVYTIRKFEYDNEEIVMNEERTEEYTVLRAYDPKDGNIELIVIKGVNAIAGT